MQNTSLINVSFFEIITQEPLHYTYISQVIFLKIRNGLPDTLKDYENL
jgi:hypothetical protein